MTVGSLDAARTREADLINEYNLAMFLKGKDDVLDDLLDRLVIL